jgi:hypothetical protein
MTTPVINTRDFSKLDFSDQRQKLVDFLSTQTEFQDFNFNGPAISILIDALTYTNLQLSTYANFSLSEVFLDSAQIRGSVVSRAKELGYTPRSVSAAYAELRLTVVLGSANTGITNFYIPAWSKFAANVNNQAFTFMTTNRYQLLEERDSNNIVINPGTYVADVVVYEGLLTQQSFLYTSDTLQQLFTFTNQMIDTRFMTVTTTEANNSTNILTWVQSPNIVKVGPTDQVYFIQEGPDGFWQMYFGDNIVGAAPSVNSRIKAQYLATQGAGANGISVFALVDTISYLSPLSSSNVNVPGTAFAVTTVTPSGYGADRESIDSIRDAAPKAYKAQNRAVTVQDYISILQNQYGYIESAAVWGGQDNIPPFYGKVFVSVKPKYGNYLSPLTKVAIENNLSQNYSVVGITPVVVDPDFTFAFITSNVFYNQTMTTLTSGDLNNLVTKTIDDFFTSNVSFFSGVFRYSKLLGAIDDTDPSIQGNDTTVQMAKIFTPTPGVLQEWNFQFYNPIVPGSVITDVFTASSNQGVTLQDDGAGHLNQYVLGVLVATGIGTVNYTTGIINLNSFVFNVPANTTITMRAKPATNDLVTVRNNLIVLQKTNVQVQSI